MANAGLADHLRKWGLKVVEVRGWESRTAGGTFAPRAIICHHTAGPRSGDAPSLSLVTYGRGGPSPIEGPLSQFVLGRSGTVYLVAGGRANHAGRGGPEAGMPRDTGNAYAWGIEAENNGVGEPWGTAQMNAYYRLCAALCAYSDISANEVIGHREWTSRKIDPAGINMNHFRERVSQAYHAGPAVVKAAEVERTKNGDPILKLGSKGQSVSNVQRALGLKPDGDFGKVTHDAVVIFQRRLSLEGDGIVGSETWRGLRGAAHDAKTSKGDWILSFGDNGISVENVQRALGLRTHGWFNISTERAVMDFQEESGLKPTGIVDERTWAALRAKIISDAESDKE